MADDKKAGKEDLHNTQVDADFVRLTKFAKDNIDPVNTSYEEEDDNYGFKGRAPIVESVNALFRHFPKTRPFAEMMVKQVTDYFELKLGTARFSDEEKKIIVDLVMGIGIKKRRKIGSCKIVKPESGSLFDNKARIEMRAEVVAAGTALANSDLGKDKDFELRWYGRVLPKDPKRKGLDEFKKDVEELKKKIKEEMGKTTKKEVREVLEENGFEWLKGIDNNLTPPDFSLSFLKGGERFIFALFVSQHVFKNNYDLDLSVLEVFDKDDSDDVGPTPPTDKKIIGGHGDIDLLGRVVLKKGDKLELIEESAEADRPVVFLPGNVIRKHVDNHGAFRMPYVYEGDTDLKIKIIASYAKGRAQGEQEVTITKKEVTDNKGVVKVKPIVLVPNTYDPAKDPVKPTTQGGAPLDIDLPEEPPKTKMPYVRPEVKERAPPVGFLPQGNIEKIEILKVSGSEVVADKARILYGAPLYLWGKVKCDMSHYYTWMLDGKVIKGWTQGSGDAVCIFGVDKNGNYLKEKVEQSLTLGQHKLTLRAMPLVMQQQDFLVKPQDSKVKDKEMTLEVYMLPRLDIPFEKIEHVLNWLVNGQINREVDLRKSLQKIENEARLNSQNDHEFVKEIVDSNLNWKFIFENYFKMPFERVAREIIELEKTVHLLTPPSEMDREFYKLLDFHTRKARRTFDSKFDSGLLSDTTREIFDYYGDNWRDILRKDLKLSDGTINLLEKNLDIAEIKDKISGGTKDFLNVLPKEWWVLSKRYQLTQAGLRWFMKQIWETEIEQRQLLLFKGLKRRDGPKKIILELFYHLAMAAKMRGLLQSPRLRFNLLGKTPAELETTQITPSADSPEAEVTPIEEAEKMEKAVKPKTPLLIAFITGLRNAFGISINKDSGQVEQTIMEFLGSKGIADVPIRAYKNLWFVNFPGSDDWYILPQKGIKIDINLEDYKNWPYWYNFNGGSGVIEEIETFSIAKLVKAEGGKDAFSVAEKKRGTLTLK